MALFDFEKHQANKILKGFIDDDIEKAKAVPIGTIMTRKSGLVEQKTADGWKTIPKTHPQHPLNVSGVYTDKVKKEDKGVLQVEGKRFKVGDELILIFPMSGAMIPDGSKGKITQVDTNSVDVTFDTGQGKRRNILLTMSWLRDKVRNLSDEKRLSDKKSSSNKSVSEGDFFIHHYSSGPPSKVKVEKIEGDKVLIAEPLSMSGNSYTTKNNLYLPLSDVIAKVNEFKAKHSKPNNVSSDGKEATQSAPKSSSEQSKETKESKSNLEYALKTVNSIKEKLAKIYVPTHKSYQVLSDAVDKFKKSANILIDKNPNIEFRFSIDEGWYDKNEHCSVSFDVSLYKPFLIEKNRAEYDEQRKKYKYGFSVDSFVAQKLKEFCAESGVNLRGGESGYSTNNSGAVYLPITSCEL